MIAALGTHGIGILVWFAEQLDHPPVQATAAATWTDADPIVKAGVGTATGLVSVPGRYMHSPNEVISLADTEQAASIIAEFVSSLTPESDFRPGS